MQSFLYGLGGMCKHDLISPAVRLRSTNPHHCLAKEQRTERYLHCLLDVDHRDPHGCKRLDGCQGHAAAGGSRSMDLQE